MCSSALWKGILEVERRSGPGPKRACFSGQPPSPIYPPPQLRPLFDARLVLIGLTPRFKLNLPAAEGEELDSESLIRTKALDAGVLALPGNVFLPGKGRKTGYVRASFSLLDEADVEEACRRLGAVVKEAREG